MQINHYDALKPRAPVKNIIRREPEFMRDVLPYFQNCYCIILAHLIYQYTGRLQAVFWISYILMPVMVRLFVDDDENVDKERCENWEKDPRFHYPLYTHLFLTVLTYIWCLCVMTNTFPNHPLFENKC